jgi:hypothetical protein
MHCIVVLLGGKSRILENSANCRRFDENISNNIQQKEKELLRNHIEVNIWHDNHKMIT